MASHSPEHVASEELHPGSDINAPSYMGDSNSLTDLNASVTAPIWRIFCFLVGTVDAFPVYVSSTETVYGLKEVINKRNNLVDKKDIQTISLHFVELPEDDNLVNAATQIIIKESALKQSKRLRTLLPRGPQEETVHFIVQPPRAGVKRKASEGSLTENTGILNQALFFSAPRMEYYNPLNNRITGCPSASPPFVQRMLDSLRQKRTIWTESDLGSLKLALGTDYEKWFKVQETSEGYPDEHLKAEFIHYGYFLYCKSFPWSEGTLEDLYKSSKEAFFKSYIFQPALYLQNKITGGTFTFGRQWPFSMIAEVGTNNHSYSPKSDFCFLLNGCPCILLEVISDHNENDRDRMLLQAGVLVRVMNSIKTENNTENKDSFIAIAIYIDAQFKATRYLVFQPDLDEKTINYVSDIFDLKQLTGALGFFRELYNIPSVSSLWNCGPNVESRLQTLKEEVKRSTTGGFTGGDRKKTKRNETESQSQNPAPSDGGSRNMMMRVYDDPLIACQISEAGYELVPEIKSPGWSPLDPLKPTLSRARRFNSLAVILKLIDQDSEELMIYKLLNGIKSASNHTITLLGEIFTAQGTIIALPEELPLPRASSTLFKTMGNNLMHQLLEGVQFMHRQNIAHLDLKPDNIVLTQSTTHVRLLIIDFSIAIRVDGQESWIEGYRGTRGWVAPEVGDSEGPNQKYQPIRADLWSTGRMLEYIADRQSGRTEYQYKLLAAKLLCEDPRERPLLSKISFEQNSQRPKRKFEIDEQEEQEQIHKRSLSNHGKKVDTRAAKFAKEGTYDLWTMA